MGADFGLHPLIHTIPLANSAQNLVAWSQEEKCGLRDVIYTFAMIEAGTSISDEVHFGHVLENALARRDSLGNNAFRPFMMRRHHGVAKFKRSETTFLRNW